MRVLFVVLSTAIGLILLIVSGSIGAWDADSIAAISLEVGAALLLVPLVFVGERQIQRRIEEFRAKLRDDIRGMRPPDGDIALTDAWDDVSPVLERYYHIRIQSTANVRVPGEGVWLGFATTRMFDQHARELYSPIYIYYFDPAQVANATFDDIYQWRSGIALGTALDRVEEIVRLNISATTLRSFDKSQIARDLQARIHC